MAMTREEIGLLRALCEVEVLTFAPEDATVAALERFENTVSMLRRMERSGWVQLELSGRGSTSRSRYRRKPHIAAARCTEQGREALRLLQ
jgi:hypothetical protein